MRKLAVAFVVIFLIWGLVRVADLGGGNFALQTGDTKVCRVSKMMTMEGGVCQWYCWRCDSGPPSGEVNSCSAGPGGCSGSFGCFTIPPQAPKGPPEAPPGSPKGVQAPYFFSQFGKSGQTPDPNNNVGKSGLKKLKKKPSVTENDGTIIDRAVLRFRSNETQSWRKAYVCLVKYDPEEPEKPCLILGCGREISADTPNTPHELESMEVAEVPDLPYLVEITVGAVTYMVALHESVE